MQPQLTLLCLSSTSDLRGLEDFNHLEELYISSDMPIEDPQLAPLLDLLSARIDVPNSSRGALRRYATSMAEVFERPRMLQLAAILDIIPLNLPIDSYRDPLFLPAVASLRPALLEQASKRYPPRVEALDVKSVLRKHEELEPFTFKDCLRDDKIVQAIVQCFNQSMEREGD